MKSSETFKKVFAYIKKYHFFLLLSFVLSIVAVVTQLYIPKCFGKEIDFLLGKGKVDFLSLKSMSLQILLWIGISAISTWVMNLINNHITYYVVRDIRSQAIRKLQHLPLAYLDHHGVGEILSCMIADVEQVSDGLLLGFTQLFSGVVTILVTLYFMFCYNVWISLFVLCLTPVSFFVAKWISQHSYRLFQKQSETRDLQTAYIEEMIGNEKIVKMFGYEKHASEQFSKLNEALQDYSQKAVFVSSLTNPSTRFVNNIIYAFVALLGALFILKGNLTVGSLMVLLSYSNQYMKPFNDISSVITELQNALACADRLFQLIDAPLESQEGTEVLDTVQGNVDINDVSFAYTKDQHLIEDFNLHVKAGSKIAIVGPTGCGKTTLINLLMRFYDVDQGQIFVDGKDIYDQTRYSLRKSFGMVLQDSWIKQDTVRENIRFGKKDATDQEILEAAKASFAYSFIKRLPQGLDTVISLESLSKGQQQLLCIARIMLASPPMLILDEATSNIDTRTEIYIQKAFDQLMKGRTSFVIAHRLSTIQNADLIVVMKDGKIIETGTHHSLLAQNGFYSQLYQSQFQQVL